MSEAKRKTYTAAFKAKVGLEAIRGVKTVNEIGQSYGVHPGQVGQWKKEIQEQAEMLFENKRGPKKEDGPGEPEWLYGEIGRLKVELDWLKKKSGLSPMPLPVMQHIDFQTISPVCASARLSGLIWVSLAVDRSLVGVSWLSVVGPS